MEELTVRVKSGEKEIEIKIPMGKRSAIGMDYDGTGTAALGLVK